MAIWLPARFLAATLPQTASKTPLLDFCNEYIVKAVLDPTRCSTICKDFNFDQSLYNLTILTLGNKTVAKA